VRSAAILLALSLFTTAAAAQAPGWEVLDLGGGHRATRYLPTSVRACDALPLLLFLHGAGGTPEDYHSHLEAHAESHGFVLLLPQASGAGWSGADAPTLNAALDAVAAELTIDVTRTYIGGHSAGAAFAYILAYDSMGFAGVFTMSAPYYGVGAVSDTAYTAPIHMYYGADDPNYTGGAATALEMQWTSLGVSFETDVQPGFGHSTWPVSSVAAGFDFLAAHAYPGTPTASTCGDVDASAPADASIARDAGPSDDASILVDASPSDGAAHDASTRDGSTRSGAIASGCGCRAGSGGSGFGAVIALASILTSLRGTGTARRRSRSRSSARP
jgi:predicted esterase